MKECVIRNLLELCYFPKYFSALTTLGTNVLTCTLMLHTSVSMQSHINFKPIQQWMVILGNKGVD